MPTPKKKSFLNSRLTLKVTMYLLGLAVWLMVIILLHLIWRSYFVQTQADIVEVRTYTEQNRGITRNFVLLVYSYKFNNVAHTSSTSDSSLGISDVGNKVQKIKELKSISIYVNKLDPHISYIDLFWGSVWPFLLWIGVILGYPIGRMVEFFSRKFTK